MAKRRNNVLIASVVVIIILLFVWFLRRGENYTPGDAKFFKSDLPPPSEATIIQIGDIEKGKKYATPNGEYYLLFRADGELLFADKTDKVRWSFGTKDAGEDATAKFLKNGQICVAGSKLSRCSESDDPEVPEGQFLLVLRNNGELYIDSGTGLSGQYNFYPKYDDDGNPIY